MVDTAVSRRLGRMTIQAVDRVGAQCNGVNDLQSRAVMAGGAGTGSVGANIMLSALNLTPGRYNMTAAARSTIRKVTGTQADYMCMSCVRGIPRTRMTGRTVARR